MKRIGVMLLVLILILTPVANAETVAQQVRAPERVEAEWTSSTGKTVIPVDAPVIVPDVEDMYMIPVSTRLFEDEMVPVLAELFWPGLEEKMQVKDYKSSDGMRIVRTGHRAQIVHWGTAAQDVHIQVSAGYEQTVGFSEPQGSYLTAGLRLGNDHRLSKEINYNIPFIDTEVTGEGIEGHPLTSAQAAEIASNFLRQLTDAPFEVFAVGQAAGIIYDDDLMLAGLQQKDTGTSYVVYLARMVEGVPLLPMEGGSFDPTDRDDLPSPPVGYERVSVALDRQGRVTSFMWDSPYHFGEERFPQALLPFDSILAIASHVLPLKYQWEEDQIFHNDRAVTRIELGYLAVLQRDLGRYALTPVWNFYGTESCMMFSGEIGTSFVQLLTVSATDGTVIDLRLGY